MKILDPKKKYDNLNSKMKGDFKTFVNLNNFIFNDKYKIDPTYLIVYMNLSEWKSYNKEERIYKGACTIFLEENGFFDDFIKDYPDYYKEYKNTIKTLRSINNSSTIEYGKKLSLKEANSMAAKVIFNDEISKDFYGLVPINTLKSETPLYLELQNALKNVKYAIILQSNKQEELNDNFFDKWKLMAHEAYHIVIFELDKKPVTHKEMDLKAQELVNEFKEYLIIKLQNLIDKAKS